MLEELAALTAVLEDEIVDVEVELLDRIDRLAARLAADLEALLTRTWRRVVGDMTTPITAVQADEVARIVRLRARPLLDAFRGDLVELLDGTTTAGVDAGREHAARLLTAIGVDPGGDE